MNKPLPQQETLWGPEAIRELFRRKEESGNSSLSPEPSGKPFDPAEVPDIPLLRAFAKALEFPSVELTGGTWINRGPVRWENFLRENGLENVVIPGGTIIPRGALVAQRAKTLRAAWDALERLEDQTNWLYGKEKDAARIFSNNAHRQSDR